jgi:predicted phage-related endonuclease
MSAKKSPFHGMTTDDIALRFLHLKTELKSMTDDVDSMKAELQRRVEENSTLILRDAGITISHTGYFQERLDAKALKEEMPDIYARYAREIITTRLTVKQD